MHLLWLSTVVLQQSFYFFNTVRYLKADLLVLTTWFDEENSAASPASKFTLQCLYYRSDQWRADYTSRIIIILYLFLLLAPINSSFCTTDRIKRCYLELQNCLNLLRFCWIPRVYCKVIDCQDESPRWVVVAKNSSLLLPGIGDPGISPDILFRTVYIVASW